MNVKSLIRSLLFTLLLVMPAQYAFADESETNRVFVPLISSNAGGLLPAEVQSARFENGRPIVLVKFSPGTDVWSVLQEYRISYIDEIPSLGVYRLTGRARVLHYQLANDWRVESYEYDRTTVTLEAHQRLYSNHHDFDALKRYFGFSSGDPNDPSTVGNSGKNGDETVLVVNDDQTFDEQWTNWSLNAINAPLAHTQTTGQNVTVAILDSGVYAEHPRLASQLLPVADFVSSDDIAGDSPNGIDEDEDGETDEAVGHGTHIAGVISAVAPDATIMPIRVLNSDGGGNLSDIAEGVIYAVDHGANIINMSFSAQLDSATIRATIQYALDNDVILVAAASGNENQLDYPAGYDGVISVGAIRRGNQIADFSLPFADLVDVFAPGEMIYSTYINDDYAWWSGTSMAAPYVAGQAALLIAHGGCQPECVRDAILTYVQPVSPAMGSRGLINMHSATQNVQTALDPGDSAPSPTPPPTPSSSYTAKLYVTQDAWLKEQATNDNFGDNDELLVQRKSGDSTRSVYRFDLAVIPSTAIIQSATANLWVTQSSSQKVNVHRIIDNWGEYSAAWGNLAQDYESNPVASFRPSQSSRFASIEITSLVQEWSQGSAPNYGIMLIGQISQAESKYSSREWGTASERPYLEVTYVVPNPD